MNQSPEQMENRHTSTGTRFKGSSRDLDGREVSLLSSGHYLYIPRWGYRLLPLGLSQPLSGPSLPKGLGLPTGGLSSPQSVTPQQKIPIRTPSWPVISTKEVSSSKASRKQQPDSWLTLSEKVRELTTSTRQDSLSSGAIGRFLPSLTHARLLRRMFAISWLKSNRNAT